MKRHDAAIYPVERWADEENHSLRTQRGMTAAESVRRAALLRAKHIEEFGIGTVTVYGFDNPFRSEYAQAVLLADARREYLLVKGIRKANPHHGPLEKIVEVMKRC